MRKSILLYHHTLLTESAHEPCGILRLVRDVFHISGLLRFDTLTHLVEIVLNQDARLAHSLIRPLRELLTPLHIVVSLGET